MDKLKNRLKYYLVGLSIGMIFVYFMFGNRGCAWLPGNRVKNMVGEKEIIAGDSILATMECLDLNNDDIYELLKSDGNVEFTLSITDTYPKIYHIKGEKDDATYWAKFALYDQEDLSEVIAIERADKKACDITVSNETKSTIPLPHADVIAILESQEFRILTEAECQLAAYGISMEKIKEFHKTARIEIRNSAPRLSPNPYYYLEGQIEGHTYHVKYIVGENRTRIAKIIGDSKTDCEEELETETETEE
ncbi:hypothetical protein N8987_00880 [Crocinitomix sp.]|nr:hypothetical protein [Crocinitomix sp.]